MQLPDHIKFTQSIKGHIKYNLSDSCGQRHTLASLSETIGLDVSKLMSEPLGYASLRGDTELRQQIIKFHLGLNHHSSLLDVDNVLTFSGAQEALSAAYRAILKPGDEVVVMTPCYPSLFHMAKQLGCKVKKLHVKPNQTLSYEQFERVISDKTKLVVLNSPHNPTGAIIDSALSDRLLSLIQQYQCYLICDDVAQASNFNHLALSHRFLDYDRAFVVSVMSKSFGLAGVRVGWLVSKNKVLLNKALAFKAYGSICTSKIDEIIATAVLSDWQKLVDINNQVILSNTEKFKQFCQRYQERIHWQAPSAGILSIAKINVDQSIESWCLSVANQYNLLLLPTSLFGLSEPYVRIGLGHVKVDQALDQLAYVFQAQK